VRTTGQTVEFEGGNKIEAVFLDPNDKKKGFKVRGYNALEKRYSRWKTVTDPSTPEHQKWMDAFWLKYCKTPRSEVYQSVVADLEKKGALKRVKE